jgi:CDP-paratose 2-epimerase
MKKVLITGSGGLIGSESVRFFSEKGFELYGIDNDMRGYFFGKEASTKWAVRGLKKTIPHYHHYSVDIRNNTEIEKIFKKNKFDLIIHTAAQPSHDWSAREPLIDFEINAYGTMVLLENFRKYCPKAVFVFTSTSKVYGETPNFLPLKELKTRYELGKNHPCFKGINENMSIDKSKHSIYGASKVAADIMTQEYGKYFGLNTGIFRGNCLTGPYHSGTELHGFLAYLGKCVATGKQYRIFGYKGKQVRDNIHSYDLVNAFYHFYKKPRIAEVYNIGGGRYSHISILEAIDKFEKITGKKANIKYIKKNRIGDHIWYVSDNTKFKSHYPNWELKYGIDDILREICEQGHFKHQ